MPAVPTPLFGFSYGYDLKENGWKNGYDTNWGLLDAMLHLSVLSATTLAQPASPAAGDRYIVPVGATGTWSGNVGAVAYFFAGLWNYTLPRSGFRTRVVDVAQFQYYDGSAWRVEAAPVADDGPVAWSRLPAEVQELPIGFVVSGKPVASAAFYLVMATAATLPANLAGTVSYANAAPTANATWSVSKISGGTTTPIGTVTLTAGSSTGATLSTQAAVSFAAGDVVKLSAPAVVDTTLADVGITILFAKV